MNFLYKTLYFTLLILGMTTAQAQNHAIPFVSDRFDALPRLPDSIPELELVEIWGDSRWVHPSSPTAGDIRYAANDSIIIIGGGDYITGWEAETGLLLWEYRFDHERGISNMVRSISLAKAKPWVMAANDGNGLFIFNYYTGQLIKKIAHKGQFVFGAISPDGKWAAASASFIGWKLWDIESGEEKTGQLDRVGTVTFSPDSKYLALSSPSGGLQYRLLIVDVHNGNVNNHSLGLNDEMRQCQSLQYSPDGKQIALGFWGGVVALWDFDQEKFIFKEKIDKSWVDGLSFSDDGKKLLIMGASTIRIWDKKTNALTEWSPPAELLPCTWEDGSWSKDGKRIMLACREWQRPRWFQYNKMATEINPPQYIWATPNELAFSADSKILAAVSSQKGPVLFWSIDQKEPVYSLSPPEGARGFSQIRFSQNGKYFAALPIHNLYPPEASINALYSFPALKSMNVDLKGRELMFGKKDQSLIGIDFVGNNVFDYTFTTRSIQHQPIEEKAAAIKEKFDKDPAHLSAQLWQSHSINLAHWLNTQVSKLLPAPTSKWHGPPSPLMCEHHFGGFTKDKSLYAGIGNDRVIYVYDGKTGAIVAGKSTQGSLMHAVVISPDGKYLAAAGWDGLIRLYKVPKLR